MHRHIDPHTHIDPDSFGFLIADLSRLMRADFDRRVAAFGAGVTTGEARALAHAARAGRVRQMVLAERMGVEAMTLSGVLDRLEARGLVTRTPEASDRRAKLVDLTNKGEAALSEVARLATAIDTRAAAALSGEAWELLLAALADIRDSFADLRQEQDAGERSGGL